MLQLNIIDEPPCSCSFTGELFAFSESKISCKYHNAKVMMCSS